MAGRESRQPMPSRERGFQMEPATATAAMSAVLDWPVMAVSTKFMPICDIWATNTGRPRATKRRASDNEKNWFCMVSHPQPEISGYKTSPYAGPEAGGASCRHSRGRVRSAPLLYLLPL